MFGLFKRKSPPAPPQCSSNPGIGTEVKTAFANGDTTWTEKVNLVDLAMRVFESRGYSVKNQKTWLHHSDTGYAIQPSFVSLVPLDNGHVRTATTVQINHPILAPNGVFEYQHCIAESIASSVTKGLDQWIQTDFVTLVDASQDRPTNCTMLEMDHPGNEKRTARVRRAILGPIAHFIEKPLPEPEEHPFCPCCMLTRSFEAFKGLLEADEFTGIRLYAARDENGNPQADCRVNGDDWEVGAQALRTYVSTWPQAGFEFRKQYVVLRTMEKAGV